MCLIKVANPREKGESPVSPAEDTTAGGGVTVSEAAMFSGYTSSREREREMSAMVSALTRVVYGEGYRAELGGAVGGAAVFQGGTSVNSPGGGDLASVTNNNWGNVQEYLKSSLCNAEYTDRANVALIQFWAPTTPSSTTIGGQCVLKTSNQPFALYRSERGLCEYRKYCASLEFNVFHEKIEEDNEDKFDSLIGRVFRHKKAEHGLLGDFAHKYGIRGSVFVPLFKPPSRCCLGVLELIHPSNSGLFFNMAHAVVRSVFKEASFIKPPFLISQQSTEIEEIDKALRGMCTKHQLPFAQIWIPCCISTAMASVDSPGERCHFPYLSCSDKFSSSISQNDYPLLYSSMRAFKYEYGNHDFRMGQGIVGAALLYQKPCFCRDVTQLPKTEYPLSDNAQLLGLTDCYAIWLHSTRTKNHDYVLEFFLPHSIAPFRDPQLNLKLLLATVKKQLPGFKFSSVGEESCVDVSEISVNDDEPGSVRISQTFSVKLVPESFVNEKETVQNEVVGNGDEITRRLPPMPESLQKENEVVQQLSHDEPTMEEAVRKNESNVGIVKQTNAAVTSSERIFSRAEASEREYRTTDITLSYKDLRKHFGKKLDDAAKILEVSRSTMKRACRRHNIKKWPAPKRKKVNVLRVCSGNEGIEGTYKGDPSCYDPPLAPATAGVSHNTSNSRQEQDVETVTIKATHGGHTIQFGLPFLSRKADLMKQVIKRLPLNEESFNIKYQDEENDWISIALDEDLEECIRIWKGKSTIKMLLEPKTNQTP